MKRILLALAFVLPFLGLSPDEASAACGGTTAQLTDAASATRQMALVNDPTGTNCASVNASAGAQATVAAGNTLNAVTANTTGTSIPVTGYGVVLLNVNCSVNCSGGTAINFQALDVVGTAFSIGAIPVTGASGAVTGVTNQSGAAQFCAPNFGYTSVRANVASYSAGTISVTVTPANFASCDLVQVANATSLGQKTSANSSPVVVANDQSNLPVINGGNTANTVAASQTAQVLSSTQGGGTGATGDYLSHCVVQPTTTAAGTVTILDNATVIFTFTTGTLSNLVPFPIPVGAVSKSGAWKVTTGANETVTCVGKFT